MPGNKKKNSNSSQINEVPNTKVILDSKKELNKSSLCQLQLSQQQFIEVVLEQIEGIRKDKIYEELVQVCHKQFPNLDFEMFIVCQAVNTINIRGWESITIESLARQFEVFIAKNVNHHYITLKGTLHIETYGIIHKFLKEHLDTKINESVIGKKFTELEKRLNKKIFNGYIEDKVNEMLADTINIELNTKGVKEIISNHNTLVSKTNIMQDAYNNKFKDINKQLDKLPKDIKKRNDNLQKQILQITQTNIKNKLDDFKFMIDKQYNELEKTVKIQCHVKSKPTDFTLITSNIKKLQEEIVKINDLTIQHSKSLQSINCKLQQQNNNTYKQNFELKQAIQNCNIQIKKLQKIIDKQDAKLTKYQELIDKQEDKFTVLESKLSELQKVNDKQDVKLTKYQEFIDKQEDKFSELQKTISQENKERISFQADSIATIDQLKYFNSQHQMILSMPQYQMPYQYATPPYQQLPSSDTIIAAKLAE